MAKKGNNSKLFDWIGGKKWLADELIKEASAILCQQKLTSYVEPFAGGLGSFVSLAPLLREHKIKHVYLNDINFILINFFNCVNSNHEKLFAEFSHLENEFIKTLTANSKVLNKTKDKEQIKKELEPANNFYMQKRAEFNELKKTAELMNYQLAGLFLFLQSHCFNGVYRENSSGGHNVPFNWGSKTVNLDNKKLALEFYRNLFQDFTIEFHNQSCFDFIAEFDSKSQKKTLFYFDPPYLNPAEKMENKYTKDAFGKKEQLELIKFFNNCPAAIYSNHSLKLIDDNIQATSKRVVYRKNIFSSDKDTRSNDVAEILAVRNQK